MRAPSSVEAIKEHFKDKKGSEIKFIVRRGKKKYVVQNGVIVDVYPSIFTVKTKNSNLSFSYIDILTKTVELSFVKQGWKFPAFLYFIKQNFPENLFFII